MCQETSPLERCRDGKIGTIIAMFKQHVHAMDSDAGFVSRARFCWLRSE
jgi:hypothetical protein